MQRYAKNYSAGAFAMPTAAELARTGWMQWDGPVVATGKVLTRASRRRHWTGAEVELPAGARIVTHLALADEVAVPDLSQWDFVVGYREDARLREGLAAQGRTLFATSISAASEIHGLWGQRGTEPVATEPVDEVGLAEVWMPEADLGRRAAVLEEVARIDGWHDDYPFYSDGSWSSISLRGFRADDPTWGVKPAEMGAKWNAAHPGAIDFPCEWTVLARECPALMATVAEVGWWGALERVRLLRMDGREDKPRVLRRHTDITDKAGGTRDGQVVRFHIPLITVPAVKMATWSLDGQRTEHHLAEWRCWYLDARKPHAVTNPSRVSRVHLTVDAIVDEEVRKHILAGRRVA